VCIDIAAGKFASGGCKLSLLQKDLKLAINMSDAVDQPLHVSSAVNEVSFVLLAASHSETGFNPALLFSSLLEILFSGL